MSLVIHVLHHGGLFMNLSLLHTESNVYDDIMGELSELNAQLRHTPFGLLECLKCCHTTPFLLAVHAHILHQACKHNSNGYFVSRVCTGHGRYHASLVDSDLA
jgi:hypothetical protein